MLKFSKKTEAKDAIVAERALIDAYKRYELAMKETIETYLNEFKNVSFDNEALETMLLNNFENATMQLDSNLLDIESLSYVLDLLDSQKEVTANDLATYNTLAEKSLKDIELTQKFLQKTVGCFENINLTGKKKSITILENCKKTILEDFPFSSNTKSKKTGKTKKSVESISKTLQKNFDYSSSDLLCFFPKDKNDNLVISTVQSSYKITFQNTIATIYIEDEDFNISLNTPGVQISNSETNSILFISRSGSKYTIITNSQIEIPSFIQISKISKNDDFLEVEIIRDSLNLSIEDNVINFEEINQDEDLIENDNELSDPFDIDDEDDIFEEEIIETPKPKVKEEIPPVQKVKRQSSPKTKSQSIEELLGDDDDIVDNDTLIISDSTKNVILPYKVADLRQKLHKNKNYKTLRDVVDNEYTIPIETFKNPVKSRFREAFQLIKKKEHGSLKEAISLGFELMFQSDLNPAIIAACSSLDELDIYLDCLDDNELDKFSCFKVLYNVPPSKN